MDKLDRLKQLKDGWNGEFTYRPNNKVFSTINIILVTTNLSDSSIFPLNSGGIAIEFETTKGFINVDIQNKDTGLFECLYKVNNCNKIEDSISLTKIISIITELR